MGVFYIGIISVLALCSGWWCQAGLLPQSAGTSDVSVHSIQKRQTDCDKRTCNLRLENNGNNANQNLGCCLDYTCVQLSSKVGSKSGKCKKYLPSYQGYGCIQKGECELNYNNGHSCQKHSECTQKNCVSNTRTCADSIKFCMPAGSKCVPQPCVELYKKCKINEDCCGGGICDQNYVNETEGIYHKDDDPGFPRSILLDTTPEDEHDSIKVEDDLDDELASPSDSYDEFRIVDSDTILTQERNGKQCMAVRAEYITPPCFVSVHRLGSITARDVAENMTSGIIEDPDIRTVSENIEDWAINNPISEPDFPKTVGNEKLERNTESSEYGTKGMSNYGILRKGIRPRFEPNYCEECGQEFHGSRELKTHIKASHSRFFEGNGQSGESKSGDECNIEEHAGENQVCDNSVENVVRNKRKRKNKRGIQHLPVNNSEEGRPNNDSHGDSADGREFGKASMTVPPTVAESDKDLKITEVEEKLRVANLALQSERSKKRKLQRMNRVPVEPGGMLISVGAGLKITENELDDLISYKEQPSLYLTNLNRYTQAFSTKVLAESSVKGLKTLTSPKNGPRPALDFEKWSALQSFTIQQCGIIDNASKIKDFHRKITSICSNARKCIQNKKRRFAETEIESSTLAEES